MTAFPANLRALNIARLPDGQYQASLQTDEHAPNAFSVAIAPTIADAVGEVVARRAPPLPPPPY